MGDLIALDPDEGPTLWVKRESKHSVLLIEGTDPEDPANEMEVSDREVERLYFAKERLEPAKGE